MPSKGTIFSIAYTLKTGISWDNFIFYTLPKFRKIDRYVFEWQVDMWTDILINDRQTQR